MKTGTVLAYLLFLVGFFSLSGLHGQIDDRYSIRGRIIDDISHRGILGVVATLSGGTLEKPLTSTSVDSGDIIFSGLSQGRYSLRLESSNYFPESLAELNVGNVLQADMGSLVLTAKRSVSGVVRWDNGDPMTTAIVHLMGYRGGRLTRIPFNPPVPTNNRGEFRLDGLRPRHYLVFAYPAPRVSGMSVAPRIAVPTFYPNSEDARAGTSVDLTSVRETLNAQIRMQEKKGVNVSGIVEPTPSFAEGVDVLVGVMRAEIPAPMLVGAQAKVGQAFRLDGVAPGAYTLIVITLPMAGVPLQEPSLTASPLTVRAEEPIQDIRIRLDEPAPLIGEIQVEETSPPQAAALQAASPSVKVSPVVGARIQFESQKLQSYGLALGGSDLSGAVRIGRTARGESYVLSPGAAFPCDCYLAQLSQGGTDLAAGSLPVVAGAGPFKLLLKTDGGKIEGRIVKNESLVEPGFVVLAPKNRSVEYWYRSVSALGDRTFKLNRIAPGDYDLIALDSNDDESYLDPEFLKKYVAHATSVRVSPNSHQILDLEIVKTHGN